MSKKQAKSIIFRYYAFSFFTGFHFFSAVLTPFFTDWGGITLAAAQLLQSWFTFNIFLLEIPTGVLADHIGRKYSLVLGCVAVVIATLIYGSIPNFYVFALGETFFALSVAFISGADQALVYDALKDMGEHDQATSVFGKSRTWHLAGILIAAPVGSVIAANLGINAPMTLTAIPALIATMIALTIPETKSQTQKEKQSMLSILKSGFAPILKNPQILKTTLNMSIVALSAYAVIWRYQLVLESIDIPILYYGAFHAFLVAVEAIVALNFKNLTRLFGSLGRFAGFSALATAASFIIVSLWPNLFTLALLLIFAGGFGLTRIDLLNANLNHFIDSAQRATSLSSISMIRRLALTIFNPIMGLLTDFSLPVSLFVIGLLPLLTIIFPLPKEE